MTSSEKCKAANTTLSKLARFTGKTPSTLRSWDKRNPKFFDMVLRASTLENRREELTEALRAFMEEIER